jgi:hypothetical protein
VTRFAIGDEVVVVEHDDSSRQPRPDGRRFRARVVQEGGIYAQIRYDDGQLNGGRHDVFYQESGWRAWDGEFRWRLAHLTDADRCATCNGTGQVWSPDPDWCSTYASACPEPVHDQMAAATAGEE